MLSKHPIPPVVWHKTNSTDVLDKASDSLK